MVTVRLPDNDPGRLSMLSRTVSTGWNDHGQGRFFVDIETLQVTTDVHNRFRMELAELKQVQAERKAAHLALDEAINTLTPYVQEICSTLRRRVNRKLLSGNLLAYYGLPSTGNTLFPTTRAGWVELALQLQHGDDHARNAGHEGIPYRPELDNATMTAQHALHVLDNADETLTPLQEQVVLLRAEVNALTRDIRQQLRFAVRKKSQAQQRKVLYAYGLRRRYSENADSEGGDATLLDTVDTNTTPTETTVVDSATGTGAETDTEAATSVPLYYSVPLTLQSNGSGVLHTNGNGMSETV